MSIKIKFAIVGCGRIGSRHAENIVKNDRSELVAVCDNKKEKALEFSNKYNCKPVYKFENLLKLDLDVINICTPSGLHAEMSINALMSGKNVLCEKPMTLNLLDANRIIEAEKKSKKIFFLVKQNRYNPPVKFLKKCLDENKLGRIILIHSDVFWNRNEEYYKQDYWRGTMKLDGGSLMTQCSHFIDLMLWTGGKVKSVYASMENINHPYIETEDTGFITLNYESGAIGSLQFTTSTYQKNMEGTFTILGTEGSIKIGGEYINTLDYFNVNSMRKPILEKGAKANDYGTYKGSMSNHDKVINNVVSVLLDGDKVNTNSFQGRESVEIMQAAYISAVKHRRIEIPLTGNNLKFRIDEEKPFFGNRKRK